MEKDSFLLFFQDQITFLLCDYRQIPKGHKYDRIIVGEYYTDPILIERLIMYG